jgi:hypothetical protein
LALSAIDGQVGSAAVDHPIPTGRTTPPFRQRLPMGVARAAAPSLSRTIGPRSWTPIGRDASPRPRTIPSARVRAPALPPQALLHVGRLRLDVILRSRSASPRPARRLAGCSSHSPSGSSLTRYPVSQPVICQKRPRVSIHHAKTAEKRGRNAREQGPAPRGRTGLPRNQSSSTESEDHPVSAGACDTRTESNSCDCRWRISRECRGQHSRPLPIASQDHLRQLIAERLWPRQSINAAHQISSTRRHARVAGISCGHSLEWHALGE